MGAGLLASRDKSPEEAGGEVLKPHTAFEGVDGAAVGSRSSVSHFDGELDDSFAMGCVVFGKLQQ